MLQRLIELWDQNMPENGMIHDVILRSEHSLLEDEETKEVKLIIAPAEGQWLRQFSLRAGAGKKL